MTGHKSHEARKKTRRCPESKHSTPATPGRQLPVGAEKPANTVRSCSCVGGTISAGRGSYCCLAAEPGTGPPLRALPAAGSGRGTGGAAGGTGAAVGEWSPRQGCGLPGRPRTGRIGAPFAVPSGSTGAPAAPGTPRGSAPRWRPHRAPALGPPREERRSPSPEIPPPVPLGSQNGGSAYLPLLPSPPGPVPPLCPPPAPGARPSPPPWSRGAAAPPSVLAQAPRGSGTRPAPLPGIRQRCPRRPTLPAPGSHRGTRANGDPPRRPSAAASLPPCAGPQVYHECRARLQVSRAHLQEGRRAALIGVRGRRPRSDGTAAGQGRAGRPRGRGGHGGSGPAPVSGAGRPQALTRPSGSSGLENWIPYNPSGTEKTASSEPGSSTSRMVCHCRGKKTNHFPL
ncbi:translation initiation factor IF-2-like isoform X2 [Motacilla alba alba]|uniref:translation initiation factor IF-2-like isoform X2 n=1 Tax=Motacilla alba alba TaxID=1094192 RepID=UPI0018D4E94D|nr:translation initiation factor IF-2-like isoform X2 [Motacilla alba alba]XP_038011473.1 translation initiation factor IF-2-like isoform X2 [Motacilla alba alba]